MNDTTAPTLHDSIGTLDVMVFAALVSLGFSPLRWRDSVLTVDGVCEHNARVFLDYFGDRNIAAIKALRNVTGLDLKGAKDAFEQLRDSYTSPEMFAEKARRALDGGNYRMAAYWASKADVASFA